MRSPWLVVPLAFLLVRGAAVVADPIDLREAVAAARRGDYAAAAALVEAAEPEYAGDFRYQVLRADVMLHLGRFALARQAIEAARSLDATSEAPDGLEGLLLEAEGDLAGARASLERARTRAPDSVPVLANLARVTESLGDEQAALSFWQDVLEKRPAQADALLHYAFLLWRRGDHARADDAIVGAIRSQPENAALQAALAQYYGATGRAAESVAPARRASELAPEDPGMMTFHVMALVRAGDSAAAVEVAENATRRFPESGRSWGGLAVAASRAGRFDVAERAFQSWLSVAPNDPNAPSSYGYSLHQAGRTSEARAVLEEATRKFPGDGATWLNYAVVLSALGEVSAAEDARKRADALMSEWEQRTLFR